MDYVQHNWSSCLSVVQWNETIKLFRGGMPLRRHRAKLRYYDWSFTGSEAVDYLHNLLRRNHNFGPEVTRYQTLQLLRKFLKAHVIEDIKGHHGTEDFQDNGHLYRYHLGFLSVIMSTFQHTQENFPLLTSLSTFTITIIGHIIMAVNLVL